MRQEELILVGVALKRLDHGEMWLSADLSIDYCGAVVGNGMLDGIAVVVAEDRWGNFGVWERSRGGDGDQGQREREKYWNGDGWHDEL